jgi:hypothetical protein
MIYTSGQYNKKEQKYTAQRFTLDGIFRVAINKLA